MTQFARVESVEALKDIRACLCKFAEVVTVSLDEADAEIHRTAIWLTQDRSSFWKDQVRTRAENLIRAKLALEQKNAQKTPTGGRPSCVEERKAVAVAQRRLEEAERKLANVRRWTRQLDHEAIVFKGQVQVMNQVVDADIPHAVAQLDNMIDALESYMSLAGTDGQRGPENLPPGDPFPADRTETAPPPEDQHEPSP